MRAHVLQHAPFEGLGSIAVWLDAHGFDISNTHLYRGETVPDEINFDLLVIMGGPMSVYEEAQNPWLVEEKRFIRRVIEAGKLVLGICLGAQLIASAMGAAVYKNHAKEIGWFPVQGSEVQGNETFKFPKLFQAFHWHGDTFDLPANAIHLASSQACLNQAFQLSSNVIGLQFHLEITNDDVVEMLHNDGGELTPSEWIQSREDILQVSPSAYEALYSLMKEVLEFLLVQR